MSVLKYAGIGSRETPMPMLRVMRDLGEYLGSNGWLCRSGFADGADKAFLMGAEAAQGELEVFIPWAGFNQAPRNDDRVMVPDMNEELMALAAQHHPAWNNCKEGARKLHARNGSIILGSTLRDPVNMVICWTFEGLAGGGTGQAIRIAKTWGIPVFDIYRTEDQDACCSFIEKLHAERLQNGESLQLLAA